MRRSTVAVIGAITLCTACGGGGSDSGDDGKRKPSAPASASRSAPATRPADDIAAVRAAAAATARTTARVDERIKMGDGSMAMVFTVRGALDLAGGKGALKVRLQADGKPAVPLDEVFTGRMVHLRMPQEPTGDTSWRSVPRDQVEAHYLLRAPLNDPVHILRQVAMLPSARRVGEEKVNGAPTVHYRAEPDLKTLTYRMVTAQRAKVTSHWKDLQRQFPPYADVWVDRKGHVVRSRFGMPLGGDAGMAVSLTLSDLGKPVRTPGVPSGARAVDPSSVNGPLVG
ncbi:hypothetical protein [Streptomyces huiliensis]|uniref:hypothetical protein n=1 Tax=Streptomyces huiliensis TaxID=2876027 RepID=UPI001CBF42FB|nr:hypothetical protein [Streptomyces huiliensis]MBZ4320539.1 hypothetical protein [Streptomyces huiliensis]